MARECKDFVNGLKITVEFAWNFGFNEDFLYFFELIKNSSKSQFIKI